MIFGVLFGLVAVLVQDIVPAPAAIPREKGSTIVSSSTGKPEWTAEWTMEPSTEKGGPAVRFTEAGRGSISAYPMPVRWTLQAVWATDRSFYPLRFEKTITDNDGHTIATERKTFDPVTRTVLFDHMRAGRAVESKQLAAPADTLTVEGIAGILRFLPFDRWRPFTVHLLTNEPQLYQMKIQMRGKERVKTPAGEFECYKIELTPQLGILDVVRPFLSKTFFWFSVAPPHFWVRYQGPESGRGSPQIVMELKTYEAGR
jgi:Protein of unknown function (DUF3108)